MKQQKWVSMVAMVVTVWNDNIITGVSLTFYVFIVKHSTDGNR